MFLAGVFATLALVLSLVGLYAVVSFSVAERRKSRIAVRTRRDPRSLLGLVFSDGMRLVGVGVGSGWRCAFVLARFLETQLFGVTAHDPGTFIAVPVFLFWPLPSRLSHSGTTRHSHRPDDGPANPVTGGR